MDERRNQNLTFILKTLVVSTLLFIQSTIITHTLWNYMKNISSPELDVMFILKVGFMLLLITYTYALTIGAWDVWLQYIIVPLPISLGIALIVTAIRFEYGIAIFFLSYLILSREVYFSTIMKNQLIRFNPKLILRFSIKGMLFLFALVGALFVLIGPKIHFDLGDSLAALIHNESNGLFEQIESLKTTQGVETNSIDTKTTLANLVNNVVQPYASFIAPIIAVLTLVSFSLLDSLVYAVFSLTSLPFFGLAKRLKLIHIDLVDTKQEVVKF